MRKRISFLLAVAVATSIALESHAIRKAQAYSIRSMYWAGDNPGDPVTLTYSYSNFFDGGMLRPDGSVIPVEELRGPINEALSVWASHAPLHFVEVEDEGAVAVDGAYSSGVFGQFRIGHHHIGTPNGLDVKAHAYFPGRSTIAGDVHFDDSNRWQVNGTSNLPDILGAAIHEFGHSLGLNHSEFDGANMYPAFLRHTGPGSGHLTPDDIAGIQAIYGAGSGSVSPLSIPEPTGGLLAVLAIAGFLLGRSGWRAPIGF